MWPRLYQLQVPGYDTPISLNTYGLFILVAFSAAFVLLHTRSRKVGIHPDKLLGVYLAAFAGGIIGSRLLYAFAVEPAATLANPLSLVTSSGGFAYYGGVIGGAAGVLAVAAVLRIDGWKLADVTAPAIVLGLGLGRVGCFFAGCCHGAVAPEDPTRHALLAEGTLKGQIYLGQHAPWITTSFGPESVTRRELLGLPLYPTQMWSIIAGLGIALFLVWMWRHRRFDGMVFALMLIIQPIYRFFAESFRADHRGYMISWQTTGAWAEWLPGMSRAGDSLPEATDAVMVGLTTSQTIGLAMIALGLVLFAWRWNKGVAPEQAVDTELEE